MCTRSRSRRAASRAASLTMFASWAPDSPGVARASTPRSMSSARGTSRVCTSRIPSRPRTSGLSTTIWRSKRPGLSSAGSRTSGRLVAASRITPALGSNPSISTRSWFSVCSRSSWPPPRPAPRWRPTASSSSMKTMHGARPFACSNVSLTRAAPTPTNISTKSEPDIEKNGRPASPATARASSVLPVPGGPTRRAPFGSRPPSRLKRSGSLRKSTISCSSASASSQPATSSKVTSGVSPVTRWGLERANWKARLPPPCIWRQRKSQMPAIRIQGSARSTQASHEPAGPFPSTWTPASSSCCTSSRSASKGRWVRKRRTSAPPSRTGVARTPSSSRPSRTVTDSTFCARSWARNSL